MLKRSIIFISVMLLLFVGLAMPAHAEEPQGVEGIPYCPIVYGHYTVKCNIKFYDWQCNKLFIVKEAHWILEPYPGDSLNYSKGKCTFVFKIPDWEKWGFDSEEAEFVSEFGYVGLFVRNTKGRITNKPRLSQWGTDGTFCKYTGDWLNYTYNTWIINTKVKVDRNTEEVKSIKGRIDGWGEAGYPVYVPLPPAPSAFPPPYYPTLGQFEGKFTATYAGPLLP